MPPQDFKTRSSPLLKHPQVLAMYAGLRQQLLQALDTQGFEARQGISAAAEVFNCKDGAELLGWDEYYDPHSQQLLLLSLTLGVLAAGPQAGACSLTARFCYPDRFSSEAAFMALTLPMTTGFDATPDAFETLAHQLLEHTAGDIEWTGQVASRFARWLQHETAL